MAACEMSTHLLLLKRGSGLPLRWWTLVKTEVDGMCQDRTFRELLGLNDGGDQGEVPAAPSTAKVWYSAYFSPMARTCTYAGSFRQAWSASMLGYI